VLIIALGEAFISIGIGATGIGKGAERVALVRDAYAYAHFPMILGIVLFAFAMKTIVGDVGEELDSVTAFALCGGCAVYLVTFTAIRIRVERRFRLSRGRFVAALVFLLVLPLATVVPALAALGLVAAVWLALHTYELVWWRDARAESRSLLASP
jgi:low temperature requirement protein LtrA